MCISRGGIDSPPYGVDYIYAVDTMMWKTCVYTVGNMGYAVGICRGVHLLVIYAVGNHMVWTTVVHTIYGLLSTVYIWCGSMVWVTLSYADAITHNHLHTLTSIKPQTTLKHIKKKRKPGTEKLD